MRILSECLSLRTYSELGARAQAAAFHQAASLPYKATYVICGISVEGFKHVQGCGTTFTQLANSGFAGVKRHGQFVCHLFALAQAHVAACLVRHYTFNSLMKPSAVGTRADSWPCCW